MTEDEPTPEQTGEITEQQAAPEKAEAPKKRGRQAKPTPEQTGGDTNVTPEANDANDGPGIYECIKECIGARTHHVGESQFFKRNPLKKSWKKIKSL